MDIFRDMLVVVPNDGGTRRAGLSRSSGALLGGHVAGFVGFRAAGWRGAPARTATTRSSPGSSTRRPAIASDSRDVGGRRLRRRRVPRGARRRAGSRRGHSVVRRAPRQRELPAARRRDRALHRGARGRARAGRARRHRALLPKEGGGARRGDRDGVRSRPHAVVDLASARCSTCRIRSSLPAPSPPLSGARPRQTSSTSRTPSTHLGRGARRRARRAECASVLTQHVGIRARRRNVVLDSSSASRSRRSAAAPGSPAPSRRSTPAVADWVRRRGGSWTRR